MPRRRLCPRSPFDTLEASFELLCTGPRPLALDGRRVEGLPDRLVPLGELKDRLLHPSTPYRTRDSAISLLLRLARDEGGRWLVGLAGVLLPGLRSATWGLFCSCPERAADTEAEVLAGFVAAVRCTPPERHRLAARLTWASRHEAEKALQAELAERGRPAHHPVSTEPPEPWGHPDLVLADAVKAGVVRPDDAALVGTTRLEGVPLRLAAQALGITLRAARDRRLLAERALVKGIREGFPAKRPPGPGSYNRGRPRQGRSPDRWPKVPQQTPATKRR